MTPLFPPQGAWHYHNARTEPRIMEDSRFEGKKKAGCRSKYSRDTLPKESMTNASPCTLKPESRPLRKGIYHNIEVKDFPWAVPTVRPHSTHSRMLPLRVHTLASTEPLALSLVSNAATLPNPPGSYPHPRPRQTRPLHHLWSQSQRHLLVRSLHGYLRQSFHHTFD